MKRFAFASLMLLCLVGCQTQKDVTPDHQPKDPKTWSPVGKIYLDGEGCGVKFINDSTIWRMTMYPHSLSCTIEYPNVYSPTIKRAEWLHFEDTTTLVGGPYSSEYGIMKFAERLLDNHFPYK